jgi:glycosyltransferase involved in cell wall biosynthesis
MKFSLIVATLGRVEEINRLFASLAAQAHQDFEVILVDQNPDNRLGASVAKYSKKFSLQHMGSTPGLSHARNIGLAAITGDVVAFPDDDCVYPASLLERVAEHLTSNPTCSGITGRPAGDLSKYWSTAAGPINRFNVWKRGISYTIFLRRPVVARVGGFDETLGVGAGTPWGAGEETEYLLRAMELEFKLHYDPHMVVIHPGPIQVREKAQNNQRVFNYAMGIGRVLSLRKLPLWYVAYKCARPLAGMASAAMRLRWHVAQMYWAVFDGTVKGYLGKAV